VPRLGLEWLQDCYIVSKMADEEIDEALNPQNRGLDDEEWM
jgi:hypothetical protein